MKTIVVYRSKYGYTKKYAEWLAESLCCDIKENASFADIADCGAVICGGGIYAGKINGAKLITKNMSRLSGKTLVLFAVGSSVGRPEELEAFWEKALEKNIRENVPHFYLRGGFDYSRLGNVDRLMMNMLKKMLLGKDTLTEDDKGLLSAYETPVDFTERKNLDEIIKMFN